MPRLFVPPDQLTGSTVVLGDEAHRHLVKVLRVETGAAVVVFDGCGEEIEAQVSEIGTRTVTLALGSRRRVVASSAAITLLVAVPRGERMDLVVQKTTELGVARIVPMLVERSVVRPPATRAARWQTIAEEAARQSGRADVPAIEPPCVFGEALAMAHEGARFLLWEGEQAQPLRSALGATSVVTLAVGPEGGFSAAEVAQARAQRFVTVGLGPRILRAETAAIVGVALVQAAAGGLD